MPELVTNLRSVSNRSLKDSVRILSLAGLLCANALWAAPDMASTVFSVDYRMALETDDTNLQWSRFSVKSESNFRLEGNWSGQIETRLELADDDVGLGTTHNYAQGSRPWIDNDSVRFEVDRASIMWRKRANSLTIGKQVTPWGVLDGIQVTDRFDPVRRRDFVFSEIKPERLARWGVRWRNKIEQWHFDTSLAVDGTSSQQASAGDTFFMQSNRFTGGMVINQAALSIESQERKHTSEQSTFGVRVSHPWGDGDISLLAFRGPDNEPVLALAKLPTPDESLTVQLDYYRRSLLGLTYDVTVDETVWRMELAYIPDQMVNVVSSIPLSQADMPRLIAGVGLDWRAPQQWFVNIQVVVDYLDAGSNRLTRPSTDSVLTLRVQRPFLNERVMFKTELLASINQGDGTLRPALSYALNDQLKLQAGLDWVFGETNGQFGQFKPASRIWLAATYTF